LHNSVNKLLKDPWGDHPLLARMLGFLRVLLIFLGEENQK
jgi:hypothetical protein